MNVSIRPSLQESDPSESAGNCVVQNGVATTTVNIQVNSTTESVGARTPGRTDLNVVLQATIPTVDMEGKLHLVTKEIKSIYRDGDHFVLLASTTTGELVKLEVLPHQTIHGFKK